jgi:hypothetical protein
MRQKPTVLWNAEKDDYTTTNQQFFTDKSPAFAILNKPEYKDDLWYWGYDDHQMITRRQEYL